MSFVRVCASVEMVTGARRGAYEPFEVAGEASKGQTASCVDLSDGQSSFGDLVRQLCFVSTPFSSFTGN